MCIEASEACSVSERRTIWLTRCDPPSSPRATLLRRGVFDSINKRVSYTISQDVIGGRMERPTEDSLSREHAPIYFPVSVLKLVILSICTFGLYELYWFGENWRCEKARTNEVLRPAWRGVFAFFFCNSLLNRIKHYATQAQVPASYSSVLLTATYILLTLCYRLPDPWWLAGMCSFLPLIPVQNVINQINAKETPTADSNARLSGANWALIVIGGSMYLLGMIGIFLPR